MLLTNLLNDFATPGNAVTGASDSQNHRIFYPLQFRDGTNYNENITSADTKPLYGHNNYT